LTVVTLYKYYSKAYQCRKRLMLVFPTYPKESVLATVAAFVCWRYVRSDHMQPRPENVLDPTLTL